MRQFDFGGNWSDFSTNALTPERVRQARTDFADLMGRGSTDVSTRSFLDIGFGQGLSLLTAVSQGARGVGCDINPVCREVLNRNLHRFPELGERSVPVVVGSILDGEVVDALRRLAPDESGYEIVHSWGVLHHTGNMWKAIDLACTLVRPGGALFLALYNRHWSSPAWTVIKRCYVAAPGWLQKTMINLFVPVILLAKWLVTRRNPLEMDRGMSFYYNVVDWVGGYPYEYATTDEVIQYLAARRFKLVNARSAVVPTGCNEYAFARME
jgi:SAM-dependent methyltransferase